MDGVNGLVYPGATFLWQSALILGAAIQRTCNFTASEEAIVIAGEKSPNVQTSDPLSDSRRPNSPLSSLAAYLGKARIVMAGIGNSLECSHGGIYYRPNGLRSQTCGRP